MPAAPALPIHALCREGTPARSFCLSDGAMFLQRADASVLAGAADGGSKRAELCGGIGAEAPGIITRVPMRRNLAWLVANNDPLLSSSVARCRPIGSFVGIQPTAQALL